MPPPIPLLETRIKTLNSVVTNRDQQHLVDEALQQAKGEWPTALASLKDKLPTAALKNVALAHSLADWSGDNVPVVKAIAGQAGLANLRDVALRFNVEKVTALADPNAVSENIATHEN